MSATFSKFNKKIYLSPPMPNGIDVDMINDAIQSNWIAPVGPYIEEFEKQISSYLGINYAVALSSGTAALHLALKVLNIKKNDIVFCSDLTFVSSANAIKYLNAVPVFIDSDKCSWNMCPKALDKAFKKYSPKAVIITDLYGQSANYEALIDICKKNNAYIVEDAAESLGAEYLDRKCGSFGDVSVLSFNGNKIITTSGGGMLLSNNKKYIQDAKKFSTQSRESVIHYEHLQIGYNYRISNLLAAFGLGQFRSLDEAVNKKRHIYNVYKKYFKEIEMIEVMSEVKGGKSSNWLSVILLKEKKYREIIEIINYFKNQNVELRPVWKPMHMQPYYHKEEFVFYNESPVSDYLFEHGLCLPSGINLKEEDQKKIIKMLLNLV